MGIIAPEAPIGIDIPNLLEFGARGDNKTDNTSAINKAIESLPKGGSKGNNGGAIFVPEGQYMHEGIPNFKKLTNVRFIGAGGICGGGGIGVGASIAATSFIYTGKGERGWDFRSAVGCGLENIQCQASGAGFTGPIWDLSGTEAEPSALCHFINARSEATRAGGKETEKILHCVGIDLDFSVSHQFDFCTVSSCLEGVQGVTNVAHTSTTHTFKDCFFVGNQVVHVINPQESWVFNKCTAESLFNDEGIIKKEGGFIKVTGAMPCNGFTLIQCWTGSNTAEKKGANVALGEKTQNVTIIGGSYNSAEIGVLFEGNAVGCHIVGTRFWKNGVGIWLKGKCIDSTMRDNHYLENTVEGIKDDVKEHQGSIIQNENTPALIGAIAEPGAFKKGAQGFETEAEAKLLLETVQKLTALAKAQGLSL